MQFVKWLGFCTHAHTQRVIERERLPVKEDIYAKLSLGGNTERTDKKYQKEKWEASAQPHKALPEKAKRFKNKTSMT